MKTLVTKSSMPQPSLLKVHASQAFKIFKVQAEKEKELKIICLKTHNGGEFTSKEFISFCSEHKIERHFSTPYTPQQNGVVVRKNRTILDMTRAMLKNKNLPKVFWGEAVSTAAYLLNGAPTKSLEGKTPHEGWTRRKPSVEHLKAFGGIVFVKTLGKSLRKLDDRSIQTKHFMRTLKHTNICETKFIILNSQ